MYELKKVKIHEDVSDETTCFSAQIWLKPNSTWPKGLPVCTVDNHGTGGPHNYGPLSLEPFKDFQKYAEAQPHDFDFDVMDQYVDDLLDQYEKQKLLKRHCKTKTLFRLKGDEKETWRTLKIPYTSKIGEGLRTKYGDQVEAIGNEIINA